MRSVKQIREDAGGFRCLRKMKMVQNGMIDGKYVNYAGNHSKIAKGKLRLMRLYRVTVYVSLLCDFFFSCV